MDIASQITVSLKPELVKSPFDQNTLKPGTILKLKILELRGDRALIDFGNFRATADIKVPVIRGQELRVRILESGRQLKMGVLGPEHKNPTGMDTVSSRKENPAEISLKKAQIDVRQIIGQVKESQAGKLDNNSIINILSRLNSNLQPVDLTKTIDALVSQLKSYLENSGVFLEKSLERSLLNFFGSAVSGSSKQLAEVPEIKHILDRDLKANLLAIKFLIEDKEGLQKLFDSRVLATFKTSINSLLSDILHQQGRAVDRMDTMEAPAVFEYFLPLNQEGQTARLKVYYQEKDDSEANKGFRISLLLSLDRLGDIRTDFFLLDKDLTITFFVQREAIQDRIQQNLPELQKLLDGFFNQILMKVVVSEKKISDFDHEDIRDTGDRQVDLRV
jgi:hypothetical protein